MWSIENGKIVEDEKSRTLRFTSQIRTLKKLNLGNTPEINALKIALKNV